MSRNINRGSLLADDQAGNANVHARLGAEMQEGPDSPCAFPWEKQKGERIGKDEPVR